MAKEEKEQKKTTPAAEENDNKETEALEEGHVVTPVEEEEIVKAVPKASIDVGAWNPKTLMGKKVKTGEIADIDQVLNSDNKLLEAEIVDVLIPTLESDLLLIGQSKGKFGGGQRRVFRQTQKKTKEGNKPSFATCAVVGDRKGHVGIGYGKSRETVPAREKAIRKAKINLIKIRRGCGSWQCNCKEPHSIPFAVEGKCGSVKVTLKPAPKGTGLCAGSEIAKILKLAGVQDVWSQTSGKTTSRINLTSAVVEALKKLTSMKVQERYKAKLNISE
ncbi:30S ribosomal protein S5 [Candidatus Woesearchaeota archaeon]|nr:30S ribosomal protein S5 [Candidatus Woesearchaeota archaeon]